MLAVTCLVLSCQVSVSAESGRSLASISPDSLDQLPELEYQEATHEWVSDAFGKGRYAQIETMGKRYRRTGARTSSGLWKSGMLYNGISGFAKELIEDDARFQILLRHHDQWIEAFPQSPMPYIARVRSIIARAFAVRGGGYASTVDPAAWPIFHQLVEQARQELERSKIIATEDPQWYGEMLNIGKLQNWPRDAFGALADEAVTRYPSYYPIYFEMTTYFLPKWHGDIQQLDLFAKAAMKRVPPEDASAIYARIYWMASQSQFDLGVFSSSAVDWRQMMSGMEAVLSRYPDQWNINNFAMFACAAGDGKTTAAMMSRIEGPPIMDAWRSRNTYEACLHLAHAQRL